MKRIPVFMAAALACLAVAAAGAGAASAETVIPHIHRDCHAETSNVRGGGAVVSVVAGRVSSSQARLASCGQADAVFEDATAQELETPGIVDYFRCVPSVLYRNPDTVEYDCHFQGADTATHIVIGFKVTYD
jgi:hypothetical protein